MKIEQSQISKALLITSEARIRTSPSDNRFIALDIIVKILEFIDDNILKNGQVIDYSLAKPWHWYALAKLGYEALKIIIEVVRAKLDASDQ